MLALLLGALGLLPVAASPGAKNVILMIADGAGFNTFDAARMYSATRPVYDGPQWIKLACSTHPLNLSTRPTGTGRQVRELVYDPVKAWSLTEGYAWLRTGATDSAAAATAIATGVKTYNNAIGMSDRGRPLTNLHQLFQASGRSTGVVTSVPWSHATPAAMVAHNLSRNNYTEIANEMVFRSGMDVILGAGHPWYDSRGERRKEIGSAAYVGGVETFRRLTEQRTAYLYLESKLDFERLANGTLDLMGKTRVLGTARAGETLQQGRRWSGDAKSRPPFADPPLPGVPSLATMARGALRVLSANSKGFFLMVEGGAVDWANHANMPGRSIEEQLDFNDAVATVQRWVERNGGWSQNLVIVTADHETGLVWGPNSGTKPFDPLVNNGPGRLPGMAFNSTGHTRSLVPVYARGAGAWRLWDFAKRTDPVRGPYLDNTDLFRLIVGAAEL
ncbi:MAG: alkaline phosphatase [Fimbriimonadales bacterium]|nr:alkaline phosphatase [Fimbriimonadales bacterium]